MGSDSVRLPFIAVSETLEGYSGWVKENIEILEWIERSLELKRDYAFTGRQDFRSVHTVGTGMPLEVLEALNHVSQTYHDIDRYLAEVDPSYLCDPMNLRILRSFLDVLIRRNDHKAKALWPSFRASVLASHEKILDCYRDSVQALQSHVMMIIAHELTKDEIDSPEEHLVPYVRGLVKALQCLAIDGQLKRDKVTYMRFERSIRRVLEEGCLCERAHIIGRRLGRESTRPVVKNAWAQLVVFLRSLTDLVFEHASETLTSTALSLNSSLAQAFLTDRRARVNISPVPDSPDPSE
ncbi:hypothetical protein JAAARDRAFT_192887 [Jaapia argillacea MUCL 33604]|uniref:Uncharacterized protein n=1 Tax=Jaapia argillacea MUCL 33604 TaxID=933084 RepID=A0A067PX25_9AGAM|nr:hypothetical protein JAAARDRAFT_192887 [Jaapia argillacea MUCL 33604]